LKLFSLKERFICVTKTSFIACFTVSKLFLTFNANRCGWITPNESNAIEVTQTTTNLAGFIRLIWIMELHG
jgi:hypothetical protein